MNKKAKVLGVTRAELIRIALMEYLFRFDDILDAKMLAEAVEKDEARRPLKDLAKELKLG